MDYSFTRLFCLGFIGLRLNTKRDEMLRAVVESIAFSMMRVVEGFMSETESKLEVIVVDWRCGKE